MGKCTMCGQRLPRSKAPKPSFAEGETIECVRGKYKGHRGRILIQAGLRYRVEWDTGARRTYYPEWFSRLKSVKFVDDFYVGAPVVNKLVGSKGVVVGFLNDSLLVRYDSGVEAEAQAENLAPGRGYAPPLPKVKEEPETPWVPDLSKPRPF